MLLENAKKLALATMSVGTHQVVASHMTVLHLGIGFAVAKGWATYNGNGEFKISDAGRAALRELSE